MELTFQRWGFKNDMKQERILFLHGMGGTGALWRPIAAVLEDEFDILAPDQRGHGGSRLPHVPGGRDGGANYTPLDYGRDLADLTEKLNFYPTFVVGHSMGVRSACAFAHLKPTWIKGLVVVDLGFSGAAGGGLGDDLGNFIKILPTEFPSREEARVFMAANCPDPAIAQYLLAVSQRDADGQTFFPFDHAALLATIEAAKNTSVRQWVKELGAASIPILILRGVKSLVWSHEEFLKEKENFRLHPSVHFEEVEGTGHGLPYEKRSWFIDRLKKFARENS